jgi:transposase-like protein
LKPRTPVPGITEFAVHLDGVQCPFCRSARVRFESLTGDSAAELLARCKSCRSFFQVMKETRFLRGAGRNSEAIPKTLTAADEGN